MIKTYTLSSIVHSGRKGIRGTSVTDSKYDGIIGQRVQFDLNKIQQYQSMRFDFVKRSAPYEWWDTSDVLAAWAEEDRVLVETANAIYKFIEVHND